MKLTQSVTNRLVALTALSVTVLLGANSIAQTQTGRAEVREVDGTVTYIVEGGPETALKVGTVLTSGAIIKTGPESTADLFLGNTAGSIRLTENTTLGLDTLNLTDTGAETVVEVQLNLPKGTILGDVNKLSPASKYEIKMPNGVAGIRGTRYRCSETAFLVLLRGTMIMVYVPPGGNPTPYTLVAPPAVFFSPLEGIKPAPPELVKELLEQFSKGKIPFLPPVPDHVEKDFEFLSPILGK